MDNGIYKIFSVKTSLGHYYVQEMPGYWGIGRDFVIMKNRRQHGGTRFKEAEKAIAYLLRELLQYYEAPKIHFPRYEQGALSKSTNVSEYE